MLKNRKKKEKKKIMKDIARKNKKGTEKKRTKRIRKKETKKEKKKYEKEKDFFFFTLPARDGEKIKIRQIGKTFSTKLLWELLMLRKKKRKVSYKKTPSVGPGLVLEASPFLGLGI